MDKRLILARDVAVVEILIPASDQSSSATQH